jgi:hypothetical protein
MKSTFFWWLFGLSSNNNHLGRQMQEYLHYRSWNTCLDSLAFWIEECSTNLLTNNEYGISWILDVFMKLVLDDFNVFSDLKMFMAKLWLCFDKCWEFGINLNPNKCIFLVYLRVILRYVVSKARKLSDLKKISTIVNMFAPKTPKDIHVFNGRPNSTDDSSRTLPSLWPSWNSYAK